MRSCISLEARPARAVPLVSAFLLALVAFLSSAQVIAQPKSYGSSFHWAYAATFGTGVYELGDTEVFVAQLPVSWTLREVGEREDRPAGIRLLFPFALAVEKFDFDDIVGGDFPSRVEQLSFLPGVEYRIVRSVRWEMKIRSQLGYGSQLGSGDDEAWIYTLGLRNRFEWPEAAGNPAWIGGILWSGYDPIFGPRESMAKFTNGVEFDIALSRWSFRGQRMHLQPHLLRDTYFDNANFIAPNEGGPSRIGSEWELGLSAGREQPFSLLRREFVRAGLAFRYSEEGTGIRFFMNSLF